MCRTLILLTLLIQAIALSATPKKPVPTYYIHRSSGEIRVDGELNEDAWKYPQVADSFYQNFPTDTIYGLTRTEVRITFDDQYLYVAAICYDDLPDKKYVVQSLKRDFSYPRNDAFAIYLDPLKDKTNGFNFTVSPLGVQREGLVSGGGIQGVTTAWDNVWYSAVKNYEDRWVVEIAIPFRSIRYNPAVMNWGMNLSRQNLKRNENTVWSPVAANFNVSTLGFAGNLIWKDSPPPAGRNLTLIPYLRANYARGEKPGYAGGIDAKIGVTSSLNLDLTVNPDFSQADVDELVINLDRFSIFFPEKRPFFQENSDLFDYFGFSRIRPFFSRRIGLYNDRVVPILAGARLSGKVGKQYRIGLMSIQTRAVDELQLNSQNFSVAAVQKQIGPASNIGFIFVNRQDYSKGFLPNVYNRIAGLDYNFATASNKLRGKVFYHQAITPRQQPFSYAHASWLRYVTRRWEWEWNHEYVGANYQAAVGYVPRKSYWRLEPHINLYLYPKKQSRIYRVYPFAYMSLYQKDTLRRADTSLLNLIELRDNLTREGFSIEYKNLALLTFSSDQYFIRLYNDFDVTNSGVKKLPAGVYRYTQGRISFVSDYRKLFSYEAYTQFGGFYTGSIIQFGGLLSYRWQPYMTFSLRVDHSDIHIPYPDQSPALNKSLTLLGPKIDVSFSRKLFLTNWLQYTDQLGRNLYLNTRLQWRFRPMSDLFIVYNHSFGQNPLVGSPYDNYYTQGQALIIKLSWWLNV